MCDPARIGRRLKDTGHEPPTRPAAAGTRIHVVECAASSRDNFARLLHLLTVQLRSHQGVVESRLQERICPPVLEGDVRPVSCGRHSELVGGRGDGADRVLTGRDEGQIARRLGRVAQVQEVPFVTKSRCAGRRVGRPLGQLRHLEQDREVGSRARQGQQREDARQDLERRPMEDEACLGWRAGG